MATYADYLNFMQSYNAAHDGSLPAEFAPFVQLSTKGFSEADLATLKGAKTFKGRANAADVAKLTAELQAAGVTNRPGKFAEQLSMYGVKSLANLKPLGPQQKHISSNAFYDPTTNTIIPATVGRSGSHLYVLRPDQVGGVGFQTQKKTSSSGFFKKALGAAGLAFGLGGLASTLLGGAAAAGAGAGAAGGAAAGAAPSLGSGLSLGGGLTGLSPTAAGLTGLVPSAAAVPGAALGASIPNIIGGALGSGLMPSAKGITGLLPGAAGASGLMPSAAAIPGAGIGANIPNIVGGALGSGLMPTAKGITGLTPGAGGVTGIVPSAEAIPGAGIGSAIPSVPVGITAQPTGLGGATGGQGLKVSPETFGTGAASAPAESLGLGDTIKAALDSPLARTASLASNILGLAGGLAAAVPPSVPEPGMTPGAQVPPSLPPALDLPDPSTIIDLARGQVSRAVRRRRGRAATILTETSDPYETFK